MLVEGNGVRHRSSWATRACLLVQKVVRLPNEPVANKLTMSRSSGRRAGKVAAETLARLLRHHGDALGVGFHVLEAALDEKGEKQKKHLGQIQAKSRTPATSGAKFRPDSAPDSGHIPGKKSEIPFSVPDLEIFTSLIS